jgi:hypothetical protein
MEEPINDEYIRQRYSRELPRENIDNLKRAMAKYSGNRWWESEDPVTIARYQIFERIFMSSTFSIFHEGLEKLLGRAVYTHEIGLNIEGIRAEASEAIARLDSKSAPLDKRIAQEREIQGIQTLFDYAEKKSLARFRRISMEDSPISGLKTRISKQRIILFLFLCNQFCLL